MNALLSPTEKSLLLSLDFAVTVALTPNGFILRIKSIGGPEPVTVKRENRYLRRRPAL